MSGLQISFWKAVNRMSGPPWYVPRESAIRELSKDLPERQWAILAERHPRNGVPRA